MKRLAFLKNLVFAMSMAVILLLASCDFDLSSLENGGIGDNVIKTEYTNAFELVSRDGKEVLSGPEIYKKVVPSVVSVLNYSVSDNLTGQGSGIIMWHEGEKSYYVVTNAHVIESAFKVEIILNDEACTVFSVQNASGNKKFWYDTYTDIGVIKIDASAGSLSPAEFGNADELEIGEEIYAIGNPGGIEFRASITSGIVSYAYRIYTPIEDSDYSVNCIQTDAPINPGNSGGPLVNMYGQVVGINSAKISDVAFEGIGLSITINDALPIISQLITSGYVSGRPALGITCTYKTYVLYTLPVQTVSGAQIESINENSAFSGTGVQVGDLIVEINGIKITSLSVVTKAFRNKKPGDEITVKYRKKNDEWYRNVHTVNVRLVEAIPS
mgnify:CR=1 FL=1